MLAIDAFTMKATGLRNRIHSSMLPIVLLIIKRANVSMADNICMSSCSSCEITLLRIEYFKYNPYHLLLKSNFTMPLNSRITYYFSIKLKNALRYNFYIFQISNKYLFESLYDFFHHNKHINE